jgi:hypothetical protein
VCGVQCINQSEHYCINKSGTWSIYTINYMFQPLHWPSSGWHLTYQETTHYVCGVQCINQSEQNCINKSGTWSVYTINYMFRPLHWPSSGWHLT